MFLDVEDPATFRLFSGGSTSRNVSESESTVKSTGDLALRSGRAGDFVGLCEKNDDSRACPAFSRAFPLPVDIVDEGGESVRGKAGKRDAPRCYTPHHRRAHALPDVTRPDGG